MSYVPYSLKQRLREAMGVKPLRAKSFPPKNSSGGASSVGNTLRAMILPLDGLTVASVVA